MSNPNASGQPAAVDLMADAAAANTTTAEGLEEVGKLVTVLALVEERIATHEAAAAKLKLQQADLLLRQIPDAMDAAHCASFKDTAGRTIEVVEVIAASIPKDKLPAAIAWLRANNHEDLIKNTITVATGKGEDETAAKVQAALKGLGVSPEVKETVHAQTLSAWCREQLAKDEPPELPAQLLGLYRARVAKIKQGKEKA